MAVELIRTPIIAYKPANYYTNRANLKLVSSNDLSKSREIASKASYEASLARALENKKFWDELLEKLRKSGGGGGPKLDKIKTSLMFTNFLSNKAIQAMLKNFNLEFLKTLIDNISKQVTNLTQSTIGKIVQSIVTLTINVIVTLFSNVIKTLDLSLVFKATANLTNQLILLAGALSFQATKLKEILEEEFKELIRKLDVKEKILNLLEAAKKIFFLQLEQALLELHSKKSLNKLKTFLKPKIVGT